jgi:hypothetical protein
MKKFDFNSCVCAFPFFPFVVLDLDDLFFLVYCFLCSSRENSSQSSRCFSVPRRSLWQVVFFNLFTKVELACACLLPVASANFFFLTKSFIVASKAAWNCISLAHRTLPAAAPQSVRATRLCIVFSIRLSCSQSSSCAQLPGLHSCRWFLSPTCPAPIPVVRTAC